MKEILIQIIGDYVISDYSWLDVPWCFSALILTICLLSVSFGLLSFMSRFSR